MYLKDLNIAIVDTETTGLSKVYNEIIEIAAIVYNPRDKLIEKEWVRKAAPRHIHTASQYALNLNGYNKNPSLYKDNIKEVISEFINIVDGCIILGQNIEFDIGFIDKYINEFELSNPIHRHRKLEISSLLWPIMGNQKSLKLAVSCDMFGVSNDGEHSALVDCQRTLKVYKMYIQLINNLNIGNNNG